jgi:hypothetical protein
MTASLAQSQRRAAIVLEKNRRVRGEFPLLQNPDEWELRGLARLKSNSMVPRSSSA